MHGILLEKCFTSLCSVLVFFQLTIIWNCRT